MNAETDKPFYAVLKARSAWLLADKPEPVLATVSPDFARELKAYVNSKRHPIGWNYLLGMEIRVEAQQTEQVIIQA